jgi:hypothetical protein
MEIAIFAVSGILIQGGAYKTDYRTCTCLCLAQDQRHWSSTPCHQGSREALEA